MANGKALSDIDVLILAGGAGTRLRPVISDRPKVIAPIGDKPFLDILLDDLFAQGFRKIHLSVGYMKESIMAHYRHDPRISFSAEKKPLGTGGAVKHAVPLFTSEDVLIMNGDSFSAVDYAGFYDFHLKRKALLSLVLARSSDRSDVGKVTMDAQGRITSFHEKSAGDSEGRFTSAGIYFIRRDGFRHMPPEEVFSIEHDFFPYVLEKSCYGFMVEGEVMDIGTPERYEKIKRHFTK